MEAILDPSDASICNLFSRMESNFVLKKSLSPFASPLVLVLDIKVSSCVLSMSASISVSSRFPSCCSSYWQYRRRGWITLVARAEKKSRSCSASAVVLTEFELESVTLLDEVVSSNAVPFARAWQMEKAEPYSLHAFL